MPNVKANSNIFIQQIEQSHQRLNAVLDEISVKVHPYTNYNQMDTDSEHDIEVLA